MARDRVISKEGAVLFWTPVLLVGWAGAVYLWPRPTAAVFALLAAGMGVVLWRTRRHDADPQPPQWVNDAHLAHVHHIGRAKAES
jgi:hypothetical protein